ncbi:MAG TPA: fatty acid desaturase [Fulvivirga sp.]|nr:fatty acid desaturase [Fulvivirga sp.]
MSNLKEPVSLKATKLLSGKALVRSSIKFSVEDRNKSWFQTFLTMALLATALTGTFYNFHIGLQLICSVLSGLLIVRFFVIYHDYQHKAILQKSKLAKFIMTLFGMFVLAPTNIWKRTHDHHHQHNSKLSNSGIGSYPLLCKNKFAKLSSGQRFKYLASRHPLTIFFGYITLFIFDFNVMSIAKSPKTHWDSFVALGLHIILGVLLYYYGGAMALLLSFFIPFILAHGFGAYLFYAQHNFPDATFEENKEWEYANAAVNSTSFMIMNPVLNWFTGNIGYHHVHHINHRIPFYRLKEAMNMMPELQSPKTTSLNIKDMVACLKLKVWDQEKGQMVGL